MKIIPWKLPIRALWPRALSLKSLAFAEAGLVLVVEEEEPGLPWRIVFKTVQAFRAKTEECAGSLLGQLPEKEGLFEVLDSPWIRELGESSFLAKAHHYIICCYDEVIEVVAWEAEVLPGEVK
jgi:hypothetical protein